MKLERALLISLLSVAVACSGGGGGGGGGGGDGGGSSVPSPTTIASAEQAAGASSAAMQSLDFVWGATEGLGGFLDLGGAYAPRSRSTAVKESSRFAPLATAQAKALAAPRRKLAVRLQKARSLPPGSPAAAYVDETEPCVDGGSVRMAGTYDDVTGAFNMTLTFNQCREYDEEANGVIAVAGSGSETSVSVTVKAGNGNGTLEASDFTVKVYSAGYVSLLETYTADLSLSATEACADVECNTFSMSLAASGKERAAGSSLVVEASYKGLKVNESFTDSASGYTQTVTINGGVTVSMSDGVDTEGASVTYYGLAYRFSRPASYDYDEVTIDGTIAFDFTPDDSCFEGVVSIDTTTPVRYTYALGRTTAGRIVVNGNVTIVYNYDGTVTVTVTGQAPQTYGSANDIVSYCG